MKRTLSIVAVGLFVAIGGAAGAAAQQGAAAAALHQVGNSGIMAEILLLDSGAPSNTLVVSGEAVGLDPEDVYFSLLYDSRSRPGGPLACEPTSSNTLTEEQMFVGFWEVNEDGTGTLFVVKTDSSYAPLGEVGTVSVREAPDELQACGKIRP